jgi:hypothetical protein
VIETELKDAMALTKPPAAADMEPSDCAALVRVIETELTHVIALTKPLPSADMEPSDCAALVGSFAKAQRRQGA